MLFVFDQMGPREFHMENTFVPLDIIFIDNERRVVGVVADNRPLSRDSVAVDGESQYVLEVHAGFAQRHGIGPGARVSFEGFEVVAPSEAEPQDDSVEQDVADAG